MARRKITSMKEPGYAPEDIDQRWEERLAEGRKAEVRRRRREAREATKRLSEESPSD